MRRNRRHTSHPHSIRLSKSIDKVTGKPRLRKYFFSNSLIRFKMQLDCRVEVSDFVSFPACDRVATFDSNFN